MKKFKLNFNQKIYLLVSMILLFFFFDKIDKIHIISTSKNLFLNRGWYYGVILFGINTFAIFSFFVILHLKNRYLKYFSLIVLILFWLINFIYQIISGSNMEIVHILTAIENLSFALEAFSVYKTIILLSFCKSFLLILFLVLFFYFLPKLSFFDNIKYSYKYLFVPVLTFLLVLSSVLYSRSLVREFPAVYRISSLVTYFTFHKLYQGERESTVKILNSSSKQQKSIILIVDESIRGDILSINDSTQTEMTPYLKSIEKSFVNFGIASSAANNSASSNLIMRTGMQLDQLPDLDQRALKKADLFVYAKNAGYKILLCDAQMNRGTFTNFFKASDMMNTDSVFQYGKGKNNGPYCDLKIIPVISEFLKKNSNTFVMFNKAGAHFPYKHFYPDSVAKILPIAKGSEDFSTTDRSKMVNSYKNAVNWGVDYFFEELLKNIDLSKTTILYTSDHGVSLLEGYEDHCTMENPPSAQATVPLIMFGNFAEKMEKNFVINSSSHFQIFPSLLIMMGYDEESVINKYGVPLWFDYSNHQRYFISGNAFFDKKFFLKNKFQLNAKRL